MTYLRPDLGINTDAINEALWAAKCLPLVIHQRHAELQALRAGMAGLQGQGTCNGSVYWRDPDGPHPKMYANHQYRQTCPTHGEPGFAKGRVRHYVGASPERQEETLAAMDRHKRVEYLRRIFDALRRDLESLRHELDETYRTLRIDRPDAGQQPDVIPAEKRYAPDTGWW